MEENVVKEKNNGKIIGLVLLVISILVLGAGVYLLLNGSNNSTDGGKSNDNTEEVAMSIEEVSEMIDEAYNTTNSLDSVQVDMKFLVTAEYDGTSTTMGINGIIQSDNINEIIYSNITIDMLGMIIPMESYTVMENDIIYTYTYTADTGWSKSEGEGDSMTVDASELLSVIDDQEFTVEKTGDNYTITVMIDAADLDTGADVSELEGVFMPMIIEIEDNYIKNISLYLEEAGNVIDMSFEYSRFNEEFNLALPNEALQ